MNCNKHDRTCPKYLHTEYSSQVSKMFHKYSLSYRRDKLAHTDEQTDRVIDRQTETGTDNTCPALGSRGKNKQFGQE